MLLHLELLLAFDLHLELALALEFIFALLLAFAIFITTQYYYGNNFNINVYIFNMKMEIIGPIILSLIAGLSTVLGSFLVFIKTKKVNEMIVFCLSFSMTIMMIISIFELIPESFIDLTNNYGFVLGTIISILVFLFGYLSISRINSLINTKKEASNLYKIGILSMISLMIHNFPEGIIVFISAYTNIKIGIKMCIAIMLHNIPEGIAISIPLYYSGKGKKNAIKYTLISGLAEPIGAILSYIFLKDYINDTLLSFILMFTGGLMIGLSISEILKEVIKYKKNDYLFVGVICACFLSLILIFI